MNCAADAASGKGKKDTREDESIPLSSRLKPQKTDAPQHAARSYYVFGPLMSN